MTWQFADVEYGGWGSRDQFVRPLARSSRFLIVTEGSSDANILKHAFRLLMPHIADFFDFVDMKEGYPFTGTGSLYNFTKGLISIAVQNNVIVIYDNDAEGVYNLNRTVKLNLPLNMRVLKLPDLPEFADFETIGTSGNHRADINGRGAAIECYLDVGASPVVRWNNFHKDLGVYHGELTEKTDVMKKFLAIQDVSENFDFSKISTVLQMLVAECVSMREQALFAELDVEIASSFPDNNDGLEDGYKIAR